MKLNLIPTQRPVEQPHALLIPGGEPLTWIKHINAHGFVLAEVKAFPLPGSEPNSLWGCLLLVDPESSAEQPLPFTHCECKAELLFIPEFSALTPALSDGELQQLLHGKPHFFHPEIGFVELGERVDWAAMLLPPPSADLPVIEPAESLHIPTRIRSIYVYRSEEEDPLKDLEKEVVPKQKSLRDEALSLREKIKLQLLRTLFKKKKPENVKGVKKGAVEAKPRKWFQSLLSFFPSISSEEKFDQMKGEYKDLEQRNEKELDKLLDMLKNNPEEALKYAIPLDTLGSSRGDMPSGSYSFLMRWNDFGLFGGSPSAGGGSVIDASAYNMLQMRYTESAKQLEAAGDFKKAAFVYLKLLNSPLLAAQCLQRGKLFKEAAMVYEDKLKDKQKAATCYEEGHMFESALRIYTSMGNHEKVGEMHEKLNQPEKAKSAFEAFVKEEVDMKHYNHAARICKTKLNAFDRGQELLLKAWDENVQAERCLALYLHDLPEDESRMGGIKTVREHHVFMSNSGRFLDVVKGLNWASESHESEAQEMAFALISEFAPLRPDLVDRLAYFLPQDGRLSKDASNYRLRQSIRRRKGQ